METTNKETYKFYAFISYRSSDEKWAKWLQKELEAYRLPTSICKKNPSIPSRIRPCFRYHTDIQPNELKVELSSKAKESKYLIIICSQRSAQSAWVGSEIETFIKLGRRNRIIPFIIDGIPYSDNPLTECFHPVLKRNFPHSDNIDEDHEILGVNINEEGSGNKWIKRQRAVIMVVSRLLDVSFDELWGRQRKRLIRDIILKITLCIAFICSLFVVWQLNKSVDINIPIKREADYPKNLPMFSQAVVTLQVDNETKHDTLTSNATYAVFRNIPKHNFGKTVHISFSGDYFLPFDTVLTLSNDMELHLCREESYFGHVQGILYSSSKQNSLPGRVLKIANHVIKTDSNGRFDLHIPKAEQNDFYIINVPNEKLIVDTLYMPCNEYTLIEIE